MPISSLSKLVLIRSRLAGDCGHRDAGQSRGGAMPGDTERGGDTGDTGHHTGRGTWLTGHNSCLNEDVGYDGWWDAIGPSLSRDMGSVCVGISETRCIEAQPKFREWDSRLPNFLSNVLVLISHFKVPASWILCADGELGPTLSITDSLHELR